MKGLLSIVPALQSATLVADNAEFYGKKNKKAVDFAHQGAKNVIGVSLIGATADLI